LNSEIHRLVEQITAPLVDLYASGYWVLSTVEVCGMPKKIQEKKALATLIPVSEMPGGRAENARRSGSGVFGHRGHYTGAIGRPTITV